MIDYNLEIKKFKPVMGIEVGSTEIFEDDMKDITELVNELVEKLIKE